jgi:hypothetical protein
MISWGFPAKILSFPFWSFCTPHFWSGASCKGIQFMSDFNQKMIISDHLQAKAYVKLIFSTTKIWGTKLNLQVQRLQKIEFILSIWLSIHVLLNGKKIPGVSLEQGLSWLEIQQCFRYVNPVQRASIRK